LKSKDADAKPEARGAVAPTAEDPNVKAAEDNLRSRLGTKVRIVRQGSGGAARGRIEIEFYSDEELDRLYSCIMDRGR
jgi:hypothetical protein